MKPSQLTRNKTQCYHCGETCHVGELAIGGKSFCCLGCRTVYQLLNQNDLCDYYSLNKNPGVNQRVTARKDKFAFLEDTKIQSQLCSYKDDQIMHITFYVPQIHCSSCLYVLENLQRLDKGINSARVNFSKKEVTIAFSHRQISLREIAELLTNIGYEPYISLNDLNSKPPEISKAMIYQLGIAGFCFANIMLMSFPEYFGIDASEAMLRNTFRWLNFGLAIPVFLYSAYPFYQSSWKSLKKKFLNIDTPIAMAILITFIRSAYEVISGTGSGYFDSMTGIVFFMLAGRVLQEKTYRHLSFDREYTSYFPLAVSVLKETKEISTPLPEINAGITILIHHDEVIPADGILAKGKALIDYSFVTGESLPVIKQVGELIYAGGKQTGSNIEILVIKEVSQSYLTKLWNHESFKKDKEDKKGTFVHLLSRYFTYIVLVIATITGLYWQINEASRVWPAVTAVFIIACPCALLLSSTFTNGNILQVLSRNHFYLRNAQTIEKIARITQIVFDKTGTLTSTGRLHISYKGTKLSANQFQQVAALAVSSSHPLSKALVNYLDQGMLMDVTDFKEIAGRGIEGFIEGHLVKLGSSLFVTGRRDRDFGTNVFVSIDNEIKGFFSFRNQYRENIFSLLDRLKIDYNISVLTGDNSSEKENLEKLLGKKTAIRFHQNPEDKLRYIKQLQQRGEIVMMIGDGLNDAGALKQSDVGVAVTEQTNNFTPSSDAILSANELYRLRKFMSLCRANKKIVSASFAVSIIYNITGLYFAVMGDLSPLIAAILMPASSLSILILTFGTTNLLARRLKL